jgi:hypothetical protein
MVGQGQRGKSLCLGQADKLGRGEPAIGGGAVRMEVDKTSHGGFSKMILLVPSPSLLCLGMPHPNRKAVGGGSEFTCPMSLS